MELKLPNLRSLHQLPFSVVLHYFVLMTLLCSWCTTANHVVAYLLHRCARTDYGYVGCAADVTRVLAARCSGRRHCRIANLEALFSSFRNCPLDLKSYVEASYHCLKGTRSSSLATLACPSTSSSLRITDRTFQYAFPRLWNQLPASLLQSRTNHSSYYSPRPTSDTSSIGSIDSQYFPHPSIFILTLAFQT